MIYEELNATDFYINIYIDVTNLFHREIIACIQQAVWKGLKKWEGLTCNISQRENEQAGSILWNNVGYSELQQAFTMINSNWC